VSLSGHPDGGIEAPKRGTGPGHVSGVLILDQLALARRLVGEDVVVRASGRISAEERAELEALLPVSWCQLTTAYAIHAAIAEEIGQDVMAWHRTIVSAGIERTLHTVWRLFMRFTSGEALVKRAASIYGKSYDRGKMHSEPAVNGTVHFVLDEWPDVPDFELDAMACGLETILTIAKKKHSRVTVERVPGGARFAVRVR
jgi:hypothetical protein